MVWPKIKGIKIKICHILIFALLFRLILAPLTFHGDVSINYWWGKFASEFNLRGYYDWLNFGGYANPDQPPLYILYYRTVREIFVFLHGIFWYLNITFPVFPSKFMLWFFLDGNQILEKIPIIFAEIFLMFLIYRFIKKYFSKKSAIIGAVILSLYPPFIYNSALWGGNDSLVNLFGLTGIYLFFKKYYCWGTFIFSLCLLFKSSLFIFLPIILVILIKNKISVKNIFICFLISLATVYLVSRPFAIRSTIPWIISTYQTKILTGSMPQLTANAFNFWALFYGILPPINDSLFFLNFITSRLFSLIFCCVLYVFITLNLYKKFTLKRLLLSLVNITLVSFIFMTRMHERYTFPALTPLFLLGFYDKKFIKYFVILSITHLLNVYNWWWYPEIKFLISFLKTDLVIRLISFINIIITLKLLSFQNEK